MYKTGFDCVLIRLSVTIGSFFIFQFFSQQQLLSQQAQHLLEEARNENRMLEESITMLKEQVNMFELEVEQIQEQAKIKESNFEEEIAMLKDQLKERNYQDVAENIELIRLQQDKKAKMTQLNTMKAQIQGRVYYQYCTMTQT